MRANFHRGFNALRFIRLGFPLGPTNSNTLVIAGGGPAVASALRTTIDIFLTFFPR